MTDFVTITCHVCKCKFGMEREFYNVAKQGAGKIVFYCPHGHGAVFSAGESELDKMRRERDRAVQDNAYWQEREKSQRSRAEVAERRVSAAKGQITKIKKRASEGICPCCNRQFANLQAHMHSKHPGYVAEPTADEHVH